ncbi:serine--tRNA ligase [bacterium]|nr:serine--tRNA ligase [bacterium]
MLDIRFVRENPDDARKGLQAKLTDPALVDQVLAFDEQRRSLIQETDELKRRKNEVSKQIPQVAKAGGDIEALKTESRGIGDKLKDLDDSLRTIEQEQHDILLRLPNMPGPDTPIGKSEDENVVRRTWGEPAKFDFDAQSHWDLGQALDILDLERGAKISGSGFYALKGAGARLQRTLVHWMLDTHTRKNGYTEIAAPHLVTRQTLTGTGQLPKLEEDMYRIESDDLFLIPTAEVPVTNLHSGEILDAEQLPIKYVGHTPCYRREAGSYGRENRGISRVHQFDKVEMVQFVLPENSSDALESLTRNAAELLEALGLTYRVLELCSADLSFAAQKCYDLEVWAPGMDRWLEVSSCSNFGDFQARRANIRFRREQGAKPEFPHTLNGSGLALPRLMIAVIENYQQADGSIKIPDVLVPMFGQDRIGG